MCDFEDRAESAEERGDFKEAFENWSRLAKEVDRPEIYCRAGLAAQELERWVDAEHAFSEALRVDSTSVEAMECMGQLNLSRTDSGDAERFQEALKWFTRALQFGRTARLLNFLGNAYFGVRNLERARRALREALDVDPSYEEAAYSLALVEKDSDPEAAIALLQNAIEIAPDYFRAHRQLGILLQRRGQLLAAEFEFRRCLELSPADFWSLLYLANVLAVQGRAADAEHQYRLALQIQPENQDGRRFFAEFLRMQGRFDEANSQ